MQRGDKQARSYHSNRTKLLECVQNIHGAPTLCLVLVTGATVLKRAGAISIFMELTFWWRVTD